MNENRFRENILATPGGMYPLAADLDPDSGNRGRNASFT